MPSPSGAAPSPSWVRAATLTSSPETDRPAAQAAFFTHRGFPIGFLCLSNHKRFATGADTLVHIPAG